MTKAFVTVAHGAAYEEMLEIARPSFEAFCDRHDYELIIQTDRISERPASWWKVPTLLAALDEFDEALFVGSDFVIVDPSEDLDVPADAWQALVEHHTGDGDVPNADMWLVRQPMRPVLKQVWEQSRFIQHGWWEQMALMHLMGYEGRPVQRTYPANELWLNTWFLDPGWNVHNWDVAESDTPRFLHATTWPDRAEIMREWAAEAAAVRA